VVLTFVPPSPRLPKPELCDGGQVGQNEYLLTFILLLARRNKKLRAGRVRLAL